MNELIEEMSNPLVSIVVVTYNSSQFVLETLESAKAQTYQNIELIISDDCSTDDTVEICSKWLGENSGRFVRTELITSVVNTGIPANCNRGFRAARGEWIKGIAGDDALIGKAIESVVTYCCDKNSINLLLTQIEVYKGTFDRVNMISVQPDCSEMLKDNELTSSKKQLEWLLSGRYWPAPGFFMKRVMVERVGYFIEKFPLIEDIPFFSKAILLGERVDFFSNVTLRYRKHEDNATNRKNFILPNYYKQYCQSLYETSCEYGKIRFVINSCWNLVLVKLLFKLGRTGLICSIINLVRIKFQPIRFLKVLNIK